MRSLFWGRADRRGQRERERGKKRRRTQVAHCATTQEYPFGTSPITRADLRSLAERKREGGGSAVGSPGEGRPVSPSFSFVSRVSPRFQKLVIRRKRCPPFSTPHFVQKRADIPQEIGVGMLKTCSKVNNRELVWRRFGSLESSFKEGDSRERHI